MYTIYIMAVFLSFVAGACGLIGLHYKERYIARLETENRRLKETVTLTETKANRYRLMLNTTLDNK